MTNPNTSALVLLSASILAGCAPAVSPSPPEDCALGEHAGALVPVEVVVLPRAAVCTDCHGEAYAWPADMWAAGHAWSP